MWKSALVAISLLVSLCFAGEILNLPGLPAPVNFKQYSGYLKASKTHYLHYWFVESQRNPEQDPVLLWMNGGPGCSSLDGFLSELGPFKINDDGATLRINPHSWNKEANVLFLEAPAGVGFSYSSDRNITTDDDQTAAENYAALKDFFAQFPSFKTNDFYITGESYAGIYVPTLASLVVQGLAKFPLNFKGMAVGNGIMDFDMNSDTLIEFAYYHGLIDQKTWNTITTVCCQGCTDSCQFHEASAGFCNRTLTQIVFDILELGLNMYDLYQDCYNYSLKNVPRFKFDMKSAYPRYQQQLARIITRKEKEHYHRYDNPGQLTREAPPCLNTTAVTVYLNRKDVRQALFIPDSVGNWDVCSVNVESNYKTIYANMKKQYQYLLSAGVRIMVYNGDTDMACNFLMGQKFVSELNRPMIKAKHPWRVDHQIAGYSTNYKNIAFVTIKGTGHMVPQWKPPQAYKMIKSFLDNEPL